MNEGLISIRYAKALYEYTSRRGEEQAFYKRMQTLSAMLDTIPKLREALSNPMVPVKYKKEILEKASGKQPEQSYIDFVRLIITNHREESLRNIALSYQVYYRRRKNISVVHITSVKQMSDEALRRIRQQVERRTHGEVEFSNHIDPDIGGGFIFRLDDIQLDASVKGQLEWLRQQLVTDCI